MGALRAAVFGIFLTMSTAAVANPTTLICQMADYMPWTEQGTTTVELNETKSQVTLNFATTQFKDTRLSYNGGPGATVGPLLATFGTDTITFKNPGALFAGSYVINRLTGSMIEPYAHWRWNCHPGQ
jgi:hypothetical protein